MRANGVANIFMIFEPLAGQRDVEVTDRRTKKDYAHCLRKISDEMYPDSEVIVVVQDNLNTHSPASLYEAFEPAEAKRLADRLELHYTPKHGSWLDMAEIELGILGRQCLARRIDNIHDLRRQERAWPPGQAWPPERAGHAERLGHPAHFYLIPAMQGAERTSC